MDWLYCTHIEDDESQRSLINNPHRVTKKTKTGQLRTETRELKYKRQTKVINEQNEESTQ